MSKHTPGPWAVHPIKAQVCGAGKSGMVPICAMLWPTDERSEEETEANADLIAAAPEMREALDRASARPAEAIAKMERNGFVFDNLDDRWQKLAFTLYTMLVEGAQDADIAIAKAEGRE